MAAFIVRNPMSKLRGLFLCSTATLYTLTDVQLWLHRTAQEARPDKTPILVQRGRTTSEQGALC